MSATDSGSQQSKTVNDQITIEFRNSSPDDESELCGFLEEQLGVKVYIELLESVHEHWPITTLFISTGAVAAKSAGKKVLDVLADKLKSWLEQKPNVKEITLYGPDGEVVKVVKKK
jgi:hypothetical protein